MEIKRVLFAELDKAMSLSYIPAETRDQFRTFIAENNNLLRADNIPHHVCTFFLPIHNSTKSIYLVHHIKANDWIPPGGHIDPGEAPIDTVRREYNEELAYQIVDEPVNLINLTVKHIRNPHHPCLTHYDFWYAVGMKERTDFTFDRGEFYDADWFPLEDGLKKMSLPMYRNAIRESVFRL